MPGQYGEDRILKLVFRGQRGGFLVDVGAANGWDNSNSSMLIDQYGWGGMLIEPEPSQFKELQERYATVSSTHLQLLNCAVGKDEGKRTMYCGGQVSTFKEEVKRSAEVNHGTKYTTAQVQVSRLTGILQRADAPSEIDFMSIDVEGMQYEVWQTLDTRQFSPKLVCMEGKGYRMHGYQELCQTRGNTFYMREDVCAEL